MANKYVLSGLGYALLGLVLGIYMAASKDHGQLVTHAHILLLGFVVSCVYGLLYKIWALEHKLAFLQYLSHQVGSFLLLVSLFCLYGGILPESILGPVLGISSIIVLVGTVLMKIIFIQSMKK
jgi:hypothetical protein